MQRILSKNVIRNYRTVIRAGTPARVFQRQGDLHRVAGTANRLIHNDLPVLERRVGKAKTKRKKRRDFSNLIPTVADKNILFVILVDAIAGIGFAAVKMRPEA
ncbi:MAG: hypothetical protein LBU80_00535 [Rikenellaceae bacterium]|nr:hypothetical protein [Rikenellaceae bacterium]